MKPNEFTQACDRGTVIFGLLPGQVAELRRRAEIPQGLDGWGAGGTGGGNGKGDHSDRTGATVVRRCDNPERDEVGDAIREIEAHVTQALRLLEKAAGAVARVHPKPVVEASAMRWCTNCETARGPSGLPILEPVYRGHLDRFCYDWQRAHGCLPPVGLIEHKASGRRLTSREIALYEKKVAS